MTAGPTLLLCAACGYDLRGLEQSEHCPECGTVIDRTTTGASLIPWVRRHQLGTWRAYWRTGAMVSLRPARLAAEVARPVDFHDARRFNRRIVLTAWATLVPLLLWAWAATMRLPRRLPTERPDGDPLAMGVWRTRSPARLRRRLERDRAVLLDR